jgi:ALG6, ALG8 glycosyltransferase family
MADPLLHSDPPKAQVSANLTPKSKLWHLWILTFVSLLATLASITPGLVYIALHPHIKRLPHLFTLTALGFFLFSFQVHEKSILLPLLPASLSFFSADAEERKWTLWFNIAASASYLPPFRFGRRVADLTSDYGRF